MPDLAPLRRKSVLELFRVAATPVAHGALTSIKDFNGATALTYPFITVSVRADATSTFDIVVQFLADTGSPTLAMGSISPAVTITDVVADGLRTQTNWIPARSARAVVYIRNTDAADHTYDVMICGVG